MRASLRSFADRSVSVDPFATLLAGTTSVPRGLGCVFEASAERLGRRHAGFRRARRLSDLSALLTRMTGTVRFRVTKTRNATTYTGEAAVLRSRTAAKRMPRARTRRELELLTAQLDAEFAKPRADYRALLKLWRALQPLEVAGRTGRKRCCLTCRAEPLKFVSPAAVIHRDACEVGAAVKRALDSLEQPLRALGEPRM